MKALISATMLALSVSAFGQCNEGNPSSAYRDFPTLVGALASVGIPIGLDSAETKTRFAHLAPYMGQFWNPRIMQHVDLTYLCTGEGVASIRYGKVDEYPWMIDFCRTFPKATRENVLLQHISDRFTHDPDQSVRRFKQWAIVDYRIRYGQRYFETSFWVSDSPGKPGFAPQMRIHLVDTTYYVERQDACLRTVGKAR